MNLISSDGSAEPETDVAMLRRKRRKRTIITPEQLLKLEELYKQEQWPGRDKKEELAREIEMSTHFVNIWFQNKRSRVKKLVQEEEEMKAMKSRVQESSQCDKKVLIAPKLDVRGNNPKTDNAAGATRHPQQPPVISTPVQGVMPSVRGLPVFTISTKNGSSRVSSVLTSLPQLAVPLIPQNTIFATIPPSADLQVQRHGKVDKDQVSLPPSTPQTPSSPLVSGRAKSSSPINLRSTHPPKRLKSTNLKTPLSPSSSTTTILPNAQQPRHHPTTLNSPQETAHDSPCKLKTSARTRDMTCNVPAPTLLRCMVLMMALSESPCSIPKDCSEFDLAVCATLYGVKLENGTMLTYNKQDGFSVDKVVRKRKSKKGKKKKKQKAGKKR